MRDSCRQLRPFQARDRRLGRHSSNDASGAYQISEPFVAPVSEG